MRNSISPRKKGLDLKPKALARQDCLSPNSGECCQFLKKLLTEKTPKNGLIVKVAHLLDVRPEKLKELQDRYRKGGETDVKAVAMP